jgi:hypothetical protein
MTLETRHEMEIRRMERTLRSYGGVLTRERLFRECGADRWPVLDSFGAALAGAVATGRLRALGDELIAVPVTEARPA